MTPDQPNQPREFWIHLDSTVLLNNRRHCVMDKQQRDEIYYNDAEGFEYIKNELHVIEYSAFKHFQQRYLDVLGELDQLQRELEHVKQLQATDRLTNVIVHDTNKKLTEERDEARAEVLAWQKNNSQICASRDLAQADLAHTKELLETSIIQLKHFMALSEETEAALKMTITELYSLAHKVTGDRIYTSDFLILRDVFDRLKKLEDDHAL